VAHRRMEQTGRAQWVDVSAQEAMTWTMLNAMEADEIQGHDFERTGLCVVLATRLQLGHRTKDGISCQVPTGVTCGPIMPWLVEEGIAPASWIDQDWRTYDHRGLSGEDIVPSFAELSDAIDELCSRHTRGELMDKGLEYGATFAPVNNVRDLLAIDHLERRGFWSHEQDRPTGTEVRRPGAPFVIDGVRPSRATHVPGLDESGPELRARPQRSRRTPTAGRRAQAYPLEGIKVADFSWVGVGPITARCLGDHGATVVRVESEHRLDTTRAQPPFKDGEFGLNRSNFYGSFNTSKRSITLNLACPEGRAIAARLTGWADVVLDAFRPGTMDRLGLGSEQVRATNPGVITVTTSLLGSGGPLSPLAGYGFHAGAIAGFTDLVGWPDRDPDGPWMAYTDTIGPRFLTTAILAALDRRDRTGAGCHIEAAQLEMGLQFLAPELLDHQLTGRVPHRIANRDPYLAPQGAYRCAGEDEWCAISVTDDETWGRFVDALGAPGWATDTRYATTAGRLADHDELDARIEAWTVDQPAEKVEAQLLTAGVPAGKVQRTRDLRVDPQYLHRRFYRRLEHAEVGVIPYAGHQFRIRGYDNGPRAAAPRFGEHTFEVLTELLGMTPEEVGDAAVAGALE
jgi:crotonobetainyl-CoA:carnitine CoA-transferase CaiB-like acyl-CoA transferase